MENREFFIEFLYRKNRRGLWNCFVELEQIKEQLMIITNSADSKRESNSSGLKKVSQFRQSDAQPLKQDYSAMNESQLSKSLDDSTSCKILISVTNDATTNHLTSLQSFINEGNLSPHGVTTLQIYDRIIRKFFINFSDVKNLNIDTIMTSAVNSLLGISRELQRETCQKFEKHVKLISQQLSGGLNLWNELFFTLADDSTSVMNHNKSQNHDNSPNVHHETSPSKMTFGFFRKLTMKQHHNKTQSVSSSALIDSQQQQHLESHSETAVVNHNSTKKKQPSLGFGFKKLSDQEMTRILEKFQECHEPSILLFTTHHFHEIFGALHSELFQKLKTLFEQYVDDSEEFEVLLMRRIIFTHKNEFPEIFKRSHSPNTTNPPSLIIPPNSAVTNTHTINTTTIGAPMTSTANSTSQLTSAIQSHTNSHENASHSSMMIDEGTASEKSDLSPSSPLPPSSSVTTTDSNLTKKTSFNLQIPLNNVSRTATTDQGGNAMTSRSVSPIDEYGMESPRSKLTSLLSFDEKKKKKKEKEETERKVQTIQDQMNKYNKIISTLYKDLVQRDFELSQLKKQEMELFDGTDEESSINDQVEPFELYEVTTKEELQSDSVNHSCPHP